MYVFNLYVLDKNNLSKYYKAQVDIIKISVSRYLHIYHNITCILDMYTFNLYTYILLYDTLEQHNINIHNLKN